MDEMPNLREDLYSLLHSAIIEGHLSAGSRIGHDESARQFGVSRTPMREAVLQLEQAGLVQSIPRRGFRVAPLCRTEVEELYPMLGCLERHAVEHAVSFRKVDIRELRTLLRRFPRTLENPGERIRCDAAIHEKLTSRCTNSKVQALLSNLRGQARRYEWFYSSRGPMETSRTEHTRIVDLVESGRLDQAGRRLERHHVDCVPRLCEYLRERERYLPQERRP